MAFGWRLITYRHTRPSSSPALLNASRRMSSFQIYVGHLQGAIDDEALKAAFAFTGGVIDARVITDQYTGKSKGFGYVSFASATDAEEAIRTMNGRDLAGQLISVNHAKLKRGYIATSPVHGIDTSYK